MSSLFEKNSLLSHFHWQFFWQKLFISTPIKNVTNFLALELELCEELLGLRRQTVVLYTLSQGKIFLILSAVIWTLSGLATLNLVSPWVLGRITGPLEKMFWSWCRRDPVGSCNICYNSTPRVVPKFLMISLMASFGVIRIPVISTLFSRLFCFKFPTRSCSLQTFSLWDELHTSFHFSSWLWPSPV